MEKYVTGTGQTVLVHDKSRCSGQHCVIHNPSGHHMKDWPTNWRDDIGVMERICEHGVGHPDPDHLAYSPRANSDAVHGCDGCCAPKTVMDHRCIQTSTGQLFRFLGPHKITIRDIAPALSKICRFNGSCKEFYSVAQHAVLVSQYVPAQFAPWGLHHDDTEAYVGDIPAPLKRMLPDYKKIEDAIAISIAEHFGLHWPMPKEVKEADLRMLATEKIHLLGHPDVVWPLLEEVEPYDVPYIRPWGPEEACERFMERFDELFVA